MPLYSLLVVVWGAGRGEGHGQWRQHGGVEADGLHIVDRAERLERIDALFLHRHGEDERFIIGRAGVLVVVIAVGIALHHAEEHDIEQVRLAAERAVGIGGIMHGVIEAEREARHFLDGGDDFFFGFAGAGGGILAHALDSELDIPHVLVVGGGGGGEEIFVVVHGGSIGNYS